MNIEFLQFDETPAEKHKGVISIRFEKRFIFRYKIVPKPEGGYYIQCASCKISRHGEDKYLPAFQLDSSYEAEEVRDFILAKLKEIMAPSVKDELPF